MKNFVAAASLAIALSSGTHAPARAEQWTPFLGPFAPPFSSNLSNTFPLAFGMAPQDVEQALGTPLQYIKGAPGDETMMAMRTGTGYVLFLHKERVYLQFRKGHLAGWKADWGHSWMWQ